MHTSAWRIASEIIDIIARISSQIDLAANSGGRSVLIVDLTAALSPLVNKYSIHTTNYRRIAIELDSSVRKQLDRLAII